MSALWLLAAACALAAAFPRAIVRTRLDPSSGVGANADMHRGLRITALFGLAVSLGLIALKFKS